MPVTDWHERPESRTKRGNQKTLEYTLRGTPPLDAADVEQWAAEFLPAVHLGYVLDDYDYETDDSNIYYVSANYRPPNQPSGEPPPVGSARFGFKINGQQTKITHKPPGNFRTRYPAPGRPVVQYEGLGDDGKKVNGVDILIPNFGFSWEFSIPGGQFTLAYIASIAEIVGCQNDALFSGFAAHTVLLTSINGSVDIGKDSTITFEFAFSPSVENQTIGNITGINKYGWDLYDIHGERIVDNGINRTKVHQVDVVQVYPDADFSILDIPGTTIPGP